MCGPCDANTKKPNAGVGVLVRKTSGVKVTRGKLKAEVFQIAHDDGRAAKYHIDTDWETEAMCYVVYGQAGGNNKDKAKIRRYCKLAGTSSLVIATGSSL